MGKGKEEGEKILNKFQTGKKCTGDEDASSLSRLKYTVPYRTKLLLYAWYMGCRVRHLTTAPANRIKCLHEPVSLRVRKNRLSIRFRTKRQLWAEEHARAVKHTPTTYQLRITHRESPTVALQQLPREKNLMSHQARKFTRALCRARTGTLTNPQIASTGVLSNHHHI